MDNVEPFCIILGHPDLFQCRYSQSFLFKPLYDQLVYSDDYFVLADYDSYIQCQEKVDRKWLSESKWAQMSIINTARMGYFSSDRSVEEYGNIIWQVKPIEVDIQNLP